MQRVVKTKKQGVQQQKLTVSGSDHGTIMKTYFGEDDAPGIKVSPTAVLISSLVFIFSVIVLHFYGRFLGK
ncbi:hypothetical protein ABK040_016403 [Willaertia magna]